MTELPDCQVSLACEVSVKAFRHSIEHAASDMGKSLKVPGFRKGKVPPQVVVSRYGREAVLDEAIRSHLGSWYAEAIAESGIEPVGDPQIEIGEIPSDDNSPLPFTAVIGVTPTAKLGKYLDIEVEQEELEISDERIEAEVERMREQVGRLEPTTEPANEGATLMIDYAGSIDGVPFDGGTASDQTIELGSGRFIPGFEEGLEGATAGETRSINVTFPEDYPAEHLAGKDAVFEITVSEVRVKRLPDLDDSFATEVGYDTLAEMRDDIRSRMTESEERRIKARFREACIDAAVENAEVPTPDAIVAGRASELWERTIRSLAQQGISREAYLGIAGKTEEEIIAEAHPDAARSLQREAVIEAIIEAEGIEPSDEDLEAALEHSAEHEKMTPAELLAVLREDGRARQLVRELSARQAVDLVEERAKVKLVPAKTD